MSGKGKTTKKSNKLIQRKKEISNKKSNLKRKKGNVKKEKNILDTIKVSEVMKTAEVVDEKTGINEIVKKFLDKKYKGIFVSKNKEIIGLINLSNLLEAIRERKHTSKLKAMDIIEKIIVINKNDTLSKAILIMNIHKSDCLAVLDGKRFLGVVTRERILNKIAKNLFSEKTSIKNEKIETNVDKLLNILKKGETNIKELEEKLDIGGEQIEEWLKILEKQKVIKIEKHFGKIKLEYVR